MKNNWMNHVLPGDILATQDEIKAAEDNLKHAAVHLLTALSKHGQGDFEGARKLVQLADNRLDDWGCSDNEIKAAQQRFIEEMAQRRTQCISIIVIERRSAQ